MIIAFQIVLHDGALTLVFVRVVVDVHRHRLCLLRPRLVPDLLEQHLRRDAGWG